MPIYEYECGECGSIVEAWQRIGSPPPDACETCGGPMQKLISHSSFVLKGGGWYSDGYSGKKNGTSSDASKPSTGSDSSSKSSTTKEKSSSEKTSKPSSSASSAPA